MIKIDDSLLEEIGLISLPKTERDQMLRQIYETLEMRVGMRLAERMTDQQLDEFERFIDTNDEAGALKWLESNFPDYKQVVATELEKLKGEIKQDSSKIIEAMQSQAVAAPQYAQPQQLPQQPQQFNPGPVDQPVPQFSQQPNNNVVQGNFPQQQPTQAPLPGSFPQPQQSPQQPAPPQQYQNIPPPPQSQYDQNQQPPMAA